MSARGLLSGAGAWRTLLGALALLVACAASARADDARPRTWLVPLGGERATYLPIEGGLFEGGLVIVDTEPTPAPGRKRISLLEELGGEPRELLTIDDGDALVLLAPPRDAALELRVLREGRLEGYRVSASEAEGLAVASPRPLLDSIELGRGTRIISRTFEDGRAPELLVVSWRGVSLYRESASGLELIASQRLPARASISPFGPALSLTHHTLLEGEKESRVVWTKPRWRPGDRLRSTRVSLSAAAGDEPCFAWIHDPDKPLVLEGGFVLDGEPPLVVGLSSTSEGFGILAEQEAVVAPLVCDVTGQGKAPLFRERTDYPVWSSASLVTPLADVTGDGVLDLVFIGVSGKLRLKGEVALFAGEASAAEPWPPRFSTRREEWSERLGAGGRMRYHEDLDGDGLRDALLADEDSLRLFRGEEPRRGRVALEKRPARELDWPEGWKYEVGPLVMSRGEAPPLALVLLEDKSNNTTRRALYLVDFAAR